MSKAKIIFGISVIVLLALSGYLLVKLFKGENIYTSKNVVKDILSEVNNYRMTVGDFKDEIKGLLPPEREMLATYQGRKEFLDDIIRKEILLQEAQRQNLDKDKDFMKTIERYWEQTLIKTLLDKKSKQISGIVHVYDYEIENYCSRMREKIWAKIVLLSDKDAAEQLVKEKDIQKGIDKVKEFVLDNEEWQWYCVGDLDWRIEKVLFSLSGSKIGRPIEVITGWIVAEVGQRKENLKADLLSKDEVTRVIRRQKETEEMENWIKHLYKQTKIKKNEELLKNLTLDTEF